MTAKKPAPRPPKAVAADDPEDRAGRLRDVGGSLSDWWNIILANQAMHALWTKHSSNQDKEKQFSATLAALAGISPKDELEGMIAAQLIAAHNAAMECYRRAMLDEQTFEGRREALTQANKLSRTHASLVEALNRHRGKGQQKVTVEHVHVHAGGQAVVGMVAAPGQPGGRGGRKLKEQPHAEQIAPNPAHAPQSPLPCPNSRRDVMPLTRDGERPMPDARRNGNRRAKRQ